MTTRGMLPDRTPAVCTVAIPVFNRRDMVLHAVESALAQTVTELEVLVVDNCSTDGTWEALQTVVDPRVRLVRNERNVGLFGNFNRCIELAGGTYLRFLCSDDALAPNCLSEEIAAMEARPEAVLLSAQARRVLPSGGLLGAHADHFPAGVYPGRTAIAGTLKFKADYGYNPINYPSGVLLRTSAVRRVGGFDASMRMAADMDLFFRVLSTGDLLVLDRLGCDITIHPHQEGARLTGQTVVMEEEYLLLDRYGAALESARERRRVNDRLGGMCLRFALGGWWQGSPASSRDHVALGRLHGTTMIGMVVSFVRLLARRVLLKLFGVRLLPHGFRGRGRRGRRRSVSSASASGRSGGREVATGA